MSARVPGPLRPGHASLRDDRQARMHDDDCRLLEIAARAADAIEAAAGAAGDDTARRLRAFDPARAQRPALDLYQVLREAEHRHRRLDPALADMLRDLGEELDGMT